MIMTLEELRALGNTGDAGDDRLKRLLRSAENAIRRYTGNDFRVRGIGFGAESKDGKLLGSHPFILPGTCVEITAGLGNLGTYTVVSVEDGVTELDRALVNSARNSVTMVDYPEDVKETAGELVLWKLRNAENIGVRSETLGRHSVTYSESENLRCGYPKELMGRLDGYRRMRT